MVRTPFSCGGVGHLLSFFVALSFSAAFLSQALSFGGANSYYLYTYRTDDQVQVLDAMQAAGLKTLRIFISQMWANQKGSNNYAVADVENPVGVYNDNILSMIDTFMLRTQQRGIKLIIALHDRYSLGCWSSDAYVQKYRIPTSIDCGSRPTDNDLTAFYKSTAAAADMDRRFAHIVAHQNPNFGNRNWGSIPEAILGFDIQNEAQGHQLNGAIPNRNWICERAAQLKPRLAAGVLVHTGGGADIWDSALDEHFNCPYIDVVSIHGYDARSWASALPPVIQKARSYGKRVIVEEFGSTGWSTKAAGLKDQIAVFQNLGVPWMVWQVNKPNNYGDFEVFTDDTASWSVLSNGAKEATGLQGAFSWPELSSRPSPPTSSPPKRSPPPFGNNKCDKCNVPLCRGGCFCDNNCDCRPSFGGATCDKCNVDQNQGGCKCDNACACKPGSCWF
ncbi:hypothetical protein Vretimale_2384 [Volvox reticuliferus]|uniref:mannan endo-1,4-beta-mannosidase n=1 Tax=Volvox reticuliferus TaxID=1737510 RepID=A0A8J4D7L2_9CHLO|nr:hypothetical protein Vretifemale_4676 [Volvox reticuliferus]GIL96594.1 hypothetical protein Vretimale_2384 [Volvox reticuliferus]